MRITGPSELAFPDYDGKGMFKSLGNLVVNPNIGLLFISMNDKPKRLIILMERTGELQTASIAWQDYWRPTHRAVRCPCHLSGLPMLYSGHPGGLTIDLHAAAKMRGAGAGLEEFRCF